MIRIQSFFYFDVKKTHIFFEKSSLYPDPKIFQTQDLDPHIFETLDPDLNEMEIRNLELNVNMGKGSLSNYFFMNTNLSQNEAQ